MQKQFRALVLFILTVFVKIKLARIKPKIIGITGSYAKTSTRDAISFALSKKYIVRKNNGTFNTEYGITLDLLGISSTGKIGEKHSIKKWLVILIKGFYNAVFSNEKYDFLVLEIGLDRPKDMDKILKIIIPDIQLITAITLNHVQFGLSSEEDVWNEKKKLVYALKKNGIAILNIDDKYMSTIIDDLKCHVFTFAKNKPADLSYSVISSNINGIKIEFIFKTEKIVAEFDILGSHHALVLSTAISILLNLSFDLQTAIDYLKDFRLPPHRMTKINGLNGSIVLDSTYNASPETIKASLDLLQELEADRKIAVIGSMNELGEFSKNKHLEIGEYASKSADILVVVGHSAELLKFGFLKNLKNKEVFTFENSKLAGDFLKTFVKKGDLLLVKGSHSIEMDKVVEALCHSAVLMRDPVDKIFLK